MLRRRKLLIATFMVFLLSIFIAANVSAQQECVGTLEGDMCWKDYNGEEPGGYMPDIDQNQDFDKVLVINEDFSGDSLPAGWAYYLWTGGIPSVSGGFLTVNGAVAYANTLYGPGETLEFVATFNNQSFQHGGFGAPSQGTYPMWNDPPWIMFSTGNTGTQLYVRICPVGDPLHPCSNMTGDDGIALGAGYLGSPHTYRIDWGVNSIDFYIDGNPVVSRDYSINTQMHAGFSDYNSATPVMTADWIKKGDIEKEYCAPVAEANSLWWLDKAHTLGIFESPYDGTGYIGGDINGDGVADILDLVQDLAVRMHTNDSHTGTTVLDEEAGIDSFITDYGLSDRLYEHTVYPAQYENWQDFFSYIETEVERSQDVKLDLGFWHVDEAIEQPPGSGLWQVKWSRRGGHAVTVAGVDSVNLKFAISDPDNDAAEVTGIGVVRPSVGHPAIPHAPTVHNDEDFASHDIYTVGPSPSPGSNMGLLNYPWKWNFPEQEWETAGPIIIPWPEPLEYSMTFTEIEAAVIVSPITSVCGNQVIETGETCDPPGAPGPNPLQPGTCSQTCTYCGDGIVNNGEACDDGNGVNGDGCENNCTVTPVCGDGLINAPGETCDPPGLPGPNPLQPGNCRQGCTYCGDGIIDPGETCDDGNGVPGDGCENNCTATPSCGDGLINVPGETCDPPGLPGPNPLQPGNCSQTCTYCGDGIVNNAEACDDGNGVNGDGCENNCTFTPSCGDGLINAPGETCDPPGLPGPNPLQPGTCSQTCTYCGDGIIDPGEACDDGNGVNGDNCRNNCVLPRCGDTILDPGEQCDDGNNVSGDGCSSTCQLEVVTVTYPNGGETIAGTPVNITWTAPPAAVKFEVGYSVAGGPWNLIASGVTVHSYNWTPPCQGNLNNNVRVAVRGRDSGDVILSADMSDAPFTVLPVGVTYPSNSGIVWTSGETRTITWQTYCTPAFVDIYRSINGGATWTFLHRVNDNPGSWSLTVPTVGVTINTARIGVRLLDQYLNGIGQDAGDYNFTVQPH
jgi:cysteine-rich repeat protein